MKQRKFKHSKNIQNNSIADSMDALINKETIEQNHVSVIYTDLIKLGVEEFKLSSDTHQYVKDVFSCLALAIQDLFVNSEKYPKHAAKDVVYTAKPFLIYLTENTFSEHEFSRIIKMFESYRVNELGLKPQSSQAERVLRWIDAGLKLHTKINPVNRFKINTMLLGTKLSKREEATQETLTSWIERMPWLRKYVDPKIIQRTASPKRIMANFSETIALYMLELDEAMDTLRSIVEAKIDTLHKMLELDEEYESTSTPVYTRFIACSIFLREFDNKHKINELRHLFLTDCILPRFHSVVREEGVQGIFPKYGKTLVNDKYRSTFKHITPTIFNEKYLHRLIASIIEDVGENPNTIFEEYCLVLLMAWQAVQPSDIKKLEDKHFLKYYSKNGISAFQVNYHKGRSGEHHFTDIIPHSTFQGRAIIRFLEKRNAKNESTNTLLVDPLSYKATHHLMSKSMPYKFFSLMTEGDIAAAISNQLKQSKFSNITQPIFAAILKYGGQNPKTYLSNLKKNPPLDADIYNFPYYNKHVKNPIPYHFFGLSLIKASAVHARSDHYREGHLVNLNSHSSATEMRDYITPANQDWVNRFGRLTRMVLNEVIEQGYKLSKSGFEDDLLARKNDLESRLEIAIPLDDEVLKNSGYERSNEEHLLPDSLVYIDSPESVIEMLHYLAQAEMQYKNLLDKCPDFLEKTVLPQCEIIELVLAEKISKNSLEDGTIKYRKYEEKLVPLFTDQLRG